MIIRRFYGKNKIRMRYYEKQAAIDTITNHRNEIIPMLTLRPDRWWIFTVTPVNCRYTYDIYEVDSLSRNILNNTTMENSHCPI